MTMLGAGVSIIAVVVGVSLAVGALRGASQIGLTGPKSLKPVHLAFGEIARIPVGHAPQPIAADDAGAWEVSGEGETTNFLWHIDARTQHVVKLPQTRGADWPAVGEGFAWVTCHGAANPCGGNSVLKLDPRTGATLATIRLDHSYPLEVSTGLGSVWVPTSHGLVKIDPTTAKVVATFGVRANRLVTAAGSLWAAGAAAVIKLDPADGGVVDRIPFRDPCELLGTAQAVWVASCQAPGRPDTLLKIAPTSDKVLYRVPLSTSGPMAFAHGRPWIVRWQKDHFEIQARDPVTGQPTGKALTVLPGPHPWGAVGLLGPPRAFIAVGAHSFWLTHVDQSDVVRVGLGGG
jgi:hypothetical protein